MGDPDPLSAAYSRYYAELDRVDPEGEDGLLGADVEQDSKYAVDDALRSAAGDLLAVLKERGLA